MPDKRYLTILLSIIAAGLILNAVVIVLVDPYRVFGLTGFNRKNFEPNTRYLKVAYLKKHPDAFDAFIVGSSRVATYPVATANALSGRRYYNMTASGGNMEGVIQEVTWLLTELHPRQLIIGLDYDAMFLTGSFGKFDLLRQEHYAVSGENPLAFYLRYLTFQPNVIRRTLRKNRPEAPVVYRFDLATGQVAFPFQDRLIAENPDRHVRTSFAAPGHAWGRLRPHNIELFFELTDRLKAHPVEVKFVINPCHHLTMREYDLDDYAGWLRTLVSAGLPVWDFSGFNSITTDNLNYYEALHFRASTGELVLKRIFGAPDSTGVPADFGTLLTPQNVEARIAALRRERQTYLTSHAHPGPQGG